MGLSFKIPSLKEQLTNGVHNCTVVDAYVLRNEDNSFVSVAGDLCVVVSFKSGELIHDVLFKLAYDQKLYLKMLALAGIDIKRHDFNRDKLIGKEVAMFIKKIFSDMEAFSYKVVNFKPVKEKGYTFQSVEYYDLNR